MTSQETMELIELAKSVAERGGNEALKYFRHVGLRVTNKALTSYDPVTGADLAAEDQMRSMIMRERPDDKIIGEERGVIEGTSDFTWHLDPIDGTRAYIAGIPVWTVLVSVSKNEVPILGVIHQPFMQEFFIGGLGKSKYIRNDFVTDISVRECKSLNVAFLSTTFPEIGNLSEQKAFEAVEKEVRLCRYGLDAYAYALLAAGHLDIVIEAGLKAYDVQAPIALIEGTGGLVTNWTGGSAEKGGRVLACGDKIIHEKVVNILSRS